MLAQHETVRLGHDHVGTGGLLLGLIGEQNGLAAEVLDAVGVTISVVRNEVERIVGFGQFPPRIEIPFTAQAQHVLELAWLAAKELHSKTVDTEHLLLGLLRQNDPDVVAVLTGMNLESTTCSRMRKGSLNRSGLLAATNAWGRGFGERTMISNRSRSAK